MRDVKRLNDILVCALLVAFVSAVYLQTEGFGLINIDDYEYLVRSKAITGGLSLAGLRWAWGSVEHAMWTPLTWVSYMIDFSLFGDDCWGAMHIHSVLLHALNASLVYVLLRMLCNDMGACAGSDKLQRSRNIAIPFLAATFWALHPLRVESVAWLASRKDVLSLAFALCAFICWTDANRRGRIDGGFCVRYALSLAFFALGAMAKPSVMTFPLLQCCIDLFIIRKIRPWMYILPAGMMLAIAVEASAAQSAGGATASLGGVPILYRVLNAMSAFGVYLRNTVLPLDLAPQCMSKYPAMPQGIVFGVVASLAAATWLSLTATRIWRGRERFFNLDELRRRGESEYKGKCDGVLTGVLWFCFGIAPFLGIANFGYHAFADRFTYIPSIGLSMAAAGLLSRIPAVAMRLAIPASVAILCALSWRQTGVWKDDKSVWEATLRVDGAGNAMAHCGLGMYAFEFDHDLDTACMEFDAVKRLNETVYWNCAQVHVYALCEAGRLDEAADALAWFRKAVWKCAEAEARPPDGTVYGCIPEPPKDVGNHVHAEVAYAMCNPATRHQAREQIVGMVERGSMTPSLAYLIFRYGVVSEDASIRETGFRELQKAEKTDYLQFRYLTKKLQCEGEKTT